MSTRRSPSDRVEEVKPEIITSKRLQQKARKALAKQLCDFTLRMGRGEFLASDLVIDATLSLTWRDLGEDSDSPVFVIQHPEQEDVDDFSCLLDGRVMPFQCGHMLHEQGWRRILGDE